MVLGLLFASAPAFFAGSAMWVLAMHRRGARHLTAWAAAGAATGAASWALLEMMSAGLGGGRGAGGGGGGADFQFLAACLACGAGAALAFRATMRLGLGLSGDLGSPERPLESEPPPA